MLMLLSFCWPPPLPPPAAGDELPVLPHVCPAALTERSDLIQTPDAGRLNPLFIINVVPCLSEQRESPLLPSPAPPPHPPSLHLLLPPLGLSGYRGNRILQAKGGGRGGGENGARVLRASAVKHPNLSVKTESLRPWFETF